MLLCFCCCPNKNSTSKIYSKDLYISFHSQKPLTNPTVPGSPFEYCVENPACLLTLSSGNCNAPVGVGCVAWAVLAPPKDVKLHAEDCDVTVIGESRVALAFLDQLLLKHFKRYRFDFI